MRPMSSTAPRIAVVAACALVIGIATPAFAYGRHHGGDLSDVFADLMLCYAEGTDAIGDLHSREGTEEERKQEATNEGIAIYNRCFTEDAKFRFWSEGAPIDRQVFPDFKNFPPGAESIGPEAWAGFVAGFFHDFAQYDYTQHHIANIESWRVGHRRARLTGKLIATHITLGAAPGAPSQCSDVATGTYSLRIAKTNRGWRIRTLELTLINFDAVFERGDGCLRVAPQ